MKKKAVVLLSGGLDSTTCLAYAISQDYLCYSLSFDYGQKHRAELNTAIKIAAQYNVQRHEIVTLSLGQLGGSALTDDTIAIPENNTLQESIPTTYVPARNTVFLAIALGWAEILTAHTIFIGVNALDYSGYPDCRPEYIAAFQNMANLATKTGVNGHPIQITTPLLNLTKAEIIKLGISLGVDYRQTISCYQASAEGLACGRCDSCILRKNGFQAAGIVDPTQYAISCFKIEAS